MKKLIYTIAILFLIGGCSNTKNLPQKEETITHYVDSIVWHDSTVYHHLYKEHYKDYVVPLDTLKMDTEYSSFKAWNDTTNMILKGEAENKVKSVPTQIKWKEKIVYKDSISVVEKPYPVEVTKEVKYIPKFFWFTFWWFIASIIYIGIRIYLKFRKV